MARVSNIILFLVFLLSSGGGSQTIFNDFTRHKTITIEWLKPSFGEDSNTTFFTSSFFLNFHLPISQNTYFVGELPFSYAKFEYDSQFLEDESGSTIGNPYVGVEYQGRGTSRFMGEFGVRIPLASDESVATGTGLFTDFIDRAEAFAPKVISIQGMFNYLHQQEQGLSLRFRGGPVLWFDTEDTGGDRSELLLRYGFIIGYNSPVVRFHGGFNGLYVVTAEEGDFWEKSFHQFGISANFGSGTVRPGFSLRVPLDEDLKEVLDSAIGLDMTFDLR